MCGRFVLDFDEAELLHAYGATKVYREGPDWSPVFSIAPSTPVPVVRGHYDDDGELQHPFEPARWGLRTFWAKEKRPRPIDARYETVMTNGMFSTSRSVLIALWTKADLDVRPSIQIRSPRPVRVVSTMRLRRGSRGASSRMTSPKYRPLCLLRLRRAGVVDSASSVWSSDPAGTLVLRTRNGLRPFSLRERTIHAERSRTVAARTGSQSEPDALRAHIATRCTATPRMHPPSTDTTTSRETLRTS